MKEMEISRDGYTIRQAAPEDCKELTDLERLCFTPEEAASEEAFAYRLKQYPEWFYLIEHQGRIIAHCDGCSSDYSRIRDELYEPENDYNPNGKYLLIFGLAVSSEYRKRGLAAALLKHMAEIAEKRGKKAVVLTCRNYLISYYERAGFVNMGKSESVHGGIEWYDMVKTLK